MSAREREERKRPWEVREYSTASESNEVDGGEIAGLDGGFFNGKRERIERGKWGKR
jgi:hypothetical protein